MICTSKHGVLPHWLEALVLETVLWVKNHTDDWVTVKFEILTSCPPEHKKIFSKAHPVKGHRLNKLERKIVARWWQLTNVQLKVRGPKQPLIKSNEELPEKELA